MADPWPETLPPLFLQDAYSEGLGDGILSTQMDQGPPKTRPLTSAVVDVLTASKYMTSAQLDDFLAFFKVTLLRGALPFTHPAPRGGDDLLVMFAAPPAWVPAGPAQWIVTMQLGIMP